MKICQVSSCFPPSYGGVETFVYNLSKRLVERGHQVKVVTTSRGKKRGKYHEWVDGIEVIRYPEHFYLFEAAAVPEIPLHLTREDYDVLHVHGMTPITSDLSLIIGRLKSKPIVLTYHFDAETHYGVFSRIVTKVYTSVARHIVKFADCIVATTNSYAKTSPVLTKTLGKVAIVPCGVDLEEFNKLDLRSNHSWNPHDLQDTLRILYVGKLIHYKNVGGLIYAISDVIKSIDNVCLTIVGNGPDRRELMMLTDELGLKDYVTFTGWVDHNLLIKYYQTADLLVLPSMPSRREGFGMVLLEAMALGKPVIASDIPGPRDVVNHKVGELVPANDHQKLTTTIVNMLKDHDKRRRMGEMARQFVRKFDWRGIALRYEEIYQGLCQEGEALRRGTVHGLSQRVWAGH